MMSFEEFKQLHERYSKLPLPKEVWQESNYERYKDALDIKEFQGWVLEEKLKQKQFDYHQFCCLIMADKIYESLDESGEIKYDEVDVVMNKWENGTFGIPIHDGGTSIIEINYCPWCGKSLKNKN
ncbi:MAG: DUF6980 family protein [Rufibacter sp.]